MKKLALATLFFFATAVGSAQVMGGPGSPMSTAAYFPLVDGARYEYMFLRGANSTATAVMHTEQAWAGMTGLTALHMSLECTGGSPCTRDREDFYAMGADGVRWFGGSSSTPEGAHYMMSLTSPEWLIKNPVTPGTMMGGGMGYQNAEQWQMSVSGMNTMTGTVAYASMYQAMGLETVVTPAGTFANCLRVREKRGSGYERDVWYAHGVGMVRWSDANEEAVLVTMHIPDGAAGQGFLRCRVLSCGTGPLFHHRERGRDRRDGREAGSRAGREQAWGSVSWMQPIHVPR